MKNRPIKIAVICFSMAVIAFSVWKYPGAAVAAVTALAALIGALLTGDPSGVLL